MSHIAIANLFLEGFTPAISGHVTQLLIAEFETVNQTRKGRVWDVSSRNGDVNLSIMVAATVSKLHDVEDELLDLDCLPEDYPECLTITSARGRADDLTACSTLCDLLRESLDCKTRGAKLSS